MVDCVVGGVVCMQDEFGGVSAVAIKVPKENIHLDVKEAFRKELAMLLNIGSHPYVIRCAVV